MGFPVASSLRRFGDFFTSVACSSRSHKRGFAACVGGGAGHGFGVVISEPMPRPAHAYRVLATAILLPGFGHVIGGFPQRGLILQAFVILMAWITWHATSERDDRRPLSGRHLHLRGVDHGRVPAGPRPTGDLPASRGANAERCAGDRMS
jgi:hypothetical protein